MGSDAAFSFSIKMINILHDRQFYATIFVLYGLQ